MVAIVIVTVVSMHVGSIVIVIIVVSIVSIRRLALPQKESGAARLPAA